MAKDLLFKRSPKEAMKYYYTIKVLEFMLSMVIATVVFFYGVTLIGGILSCI